MKASEVLTKAKALIEQPDNWTQGAYARDKKGRSVPAGLDTSYKFCSYGAVSRVTFDTYQYSGVWHTAKPICYLNEAVSSDVIKYNDSHTHAEVLAAFDKAIELARKAGD